MAGGDSLQGLIRKVVTPMFRYSIPRLGRVSSTEDEEERGRVLVLIPSLGWLTDAEGIWCYPSTRKNLKVPDEGTYVIVEWLEGNKDWPIYREAPTVLADQIPTSYDGDPATNILFEGNENNDADRDVISYNEGSLQFKMNTGILLGADAENGVARLDDAVQSTSSEDSTFWTWLSGFISVFSSWTVVAQDGGAALKALLTAFISANTTPSSLTGKITEASSKIKAED